MIENKKCKRFCEKVFIPEKEIVEFNFTKNKKYKYQTIKNLNKKNKSLAKILKKMYMGTCNQIYCQKSCKNKKWLISFTQKRKRKLTEQGAISGCRDLIKEFPGTYKNI